jgi:hypothetical protein
MATITFHANNAANIAASHYATDPTLIAHADGSGIGFFGGGFGISVPVGDYQSSTYVTNSNGTASGIQCTNTRFDAALADAVGVPGSGMVFSNDAAAISNSGLPNFQAPLNVRFEHTEGVRVQNCKLRIFDRNDISNHASGVTTKIYEVRRPNPIKELFSATQGALTHRGVDGDHAWKQFADGITMADVAFTASPGPSGLNTSSDDPLPTGDGTYFNWIAQSGESCRATRHDWYIALSASPDSIGSKTDFGLYFTLEYL